MAARPIDPAAAAERCAAVAYARTFCKGLGALVRKRRISAAEGQLLRRRISAFADGLEQGLHLEEAEHG